MRMPASTAEPALSDSSALEFKPYRAISNEELTRRINDVRAELGSRLLILGHHYQQDEVIALSDLQGDSYQLSRMAADSRDCRIIAFCGVHFMAETADIVSNRPDRLLERGGERVTVALPDMAAGCSMADMAGMDRVEGGGKGLEGVSVTRRLGRWRSVMWS